MADPVETYRFRRLVPDHPIFRSHHECQDRQSRCDAKPAPGVHGFLRRDPSNPYSFVFDDGTRYFLFGTIVANATAGGKWKEYVGKTREYGMNKLRFYINRATDPSCAEPSEVTSEPENPGIPCGGRSIKWCANLLLTTSSPTPSFSKEPKPTRSTRQGPSAISNMSCPLRSFPHVMGCLQIEWEYTAKPHEFWTTFGQFASHEDPWARRDNYVEACPFNSKRAPIGSSAARPDTQCDRPTRRPKPRQSCSRGDEWNLPKDVLASTLTATTEEASASPTTTAKTIRWSMTSMAISESQAVYLSQLA